MANHVKSYNKKEFKLESVIFKLDKGDVGSCPADKKSGTHTTLSL